VWAISTFDVDQHDITAHGVRVHFTIREFTILELLVLCRNIIIPGEAILARLYGSLDEPEIRIIDVFICEIRNKLAKAEMPNVISTVWESGCTVKATTPDTSWIKPQPTRVEYAFICTNPDPSEPVTTQAAKPSCVC